MVRSVRAVMPYRLPATVLAAAWILGFCWRAGNVRADPSYTVSIADEQISELIVSLDDSRSIIRREALVRLARLGPLASSAIPGITKRLSDDDPVVRAHAARAAFRIGISPDLAVAVLSDLLQPDEPQLSCLASLILGEIGSAAGQAVPTLQTCMKAPDGLVRLHAAEAILKIDAPHPPALRALLAGLDDESAAVRCFAANALGEAALNNELAILALQRALADVDMNVSITAALNLSKRFDLSHGAALHTADLKELAELIDDLGDASTTVRQSAAVRLGLCGAEALRAVAPLRERLTDSDFAVRVHVAHAVWQIGRARKELALREVAPAELKSGEILPDETLTGEIVPVLVDLLGISNSNTRIAAMFVLGEIGPEAGDALPTLYDMLAGSELRERLLLASVISRIQPRDREMTGIQIAGLHAQAGDVRYLSALALGSAPIGHQRRIERELTMAAADRNLRVQAAAAEALERFGRRTNRARSVISAQYQSRLGSTGSDSAVDKPVVAARQATIPTITDVSQSVERKPTLEKYEDPDEGLKPIREVRASIRPTKGDLPDDYAVARLAGEPSRFHALGMTRGWSSISYGWDAPATYYMPVYFEDINLERYGIHYGCCSPIISFGKFFGSFPFLPYKMLMQPACECHYTLGFERPNNCVPVHCFGWGCPKLSVLWWYDRGSHYCPIRAACPWTRDCRACNTDCSTCDD